MYVHLFCMCLANVFQSVSKTCKNFKMEAFLPEVFDLCFDTLLQIELTLHVDCGVKCGMQVPTVSYYYFQYFVCVVKILLFDIFM